MFYDYHVHSSFSVDCTVNPEKSAAEAVKKGLTGLCFTDHLEKSYGGGPIRLNYDGFRESVQHLKNKYSGIIDIGIGAELGLSLMDIDEINEYLDGKQFDFIIGSVHCLNGIWMYTKEYYLGKTKYEAYSGYLNFILQVIKKFDNFDVLGHLDIVRRYNDYADNSLLYADYEDMVDEILKHIIHRGKGLEINTSGKRYGLDFHHPSMEILKAYRRMGGEIITTGSDAHKSEDIAYGFQDTLELLRECGFKYVTAFKERKPVQIKI